MKRAVSERVRDARDHAAAAADIGQGFDPRDLAANKTVLSAVLFNIVITGESAKYIPREIRALAPGIPWRSIAGMRDRIEHSHWQIELDHVARVLANDLDGLIAALDRLGGMFEGDA